VRVGEIPTMSAVVIAMWLRRIAFIVFPSVRNPGP
jgi:hypothetical protein